MILYKHLIINQHEKKSFIIYNNFANDYLNSESLAAIKGGKESTDQSYEIVIIDGVPYLIRRNSEGQIIEQKPLQ